MLLELFFGVDFERIIECFLEFSDDLGLVGDGGVRVNLETLRKKMLEIDWMFDFLTDIWGWEIIDETLDIIGDKDFIFFCAFFTLEILFFKMIWLEHAGEWTLLFIVFNLLGGTCLFPGINIDGWWNQGKKYIVSFSSLDSWGICRGGISDFWVAKKYNNDKIKFFTIQIITCGSEFVTINLALILVNIIEWTLVWAEMKIRRVWVRNTDLMKFNLETSWTT